MKRSNLNNIMLNTYRHDVIRLLKSNKDNIGVELGVATGVFSLRMVESGYFSSFFGVDMYADMHNVDEYKEALKKVALHGKYKLLRMTFDEAYDLFKDESLDFIYIDGYAHNGENGGETIFEWAKKVKIGGVISGDDYHKDWPLVMEAVDEFVKLSGFSLNLTSNIEDDPYCLYPSWAVVKKTNTSSLYSPKYLIKKSALLKRPKRKITFYVASFLQYFLSKKVVGYLKLIKNRISSMRN